MLYWWFSDVLLHFWISKHERDQRWELKMFRKVKRDDISEVYKDKL